MAPAAPAALMAGLLGLLVALTGVFGLYPGALTALIGAAVLGLAAAVLGGVAKKRISARPLTLKGRAVAISGAIIGFGTILIVVVALAIQGLSNAGEIYQQLG